MSRNQLVRQWRIQYNLTFPEQPEGAIVEYDPFSQTWRWFAYDEDGQAFDSSANDRVLTLDEAKAEASERVTRYIDGERQRHEPQ